MSELDRELHEVFRAELAAALDGLATHLERLGDDDLADPRPVLRDALRIAHNVKGAARVVGFEPVSDLAHALEDVLEGLFATPDLAVAGRLAPVVAHLESLAEGADDGAAERFVAELRALAPAAPPASPGAAPRAKRRARRAKTAPVGEAREVPPGDRPAPVADETMRIHVARLDRLMAATAELLTSQERLLARGRRLEPLGEELLALAHELRGDSGLRLRLLAGRLQTIHREDREEGRRTGALGSSLREAMRRIRMIPLAGLVPVWRRIVREAAGEVGRSVRLLAEVGEVEIDRTLLDAVRDPLMHLLRNAVAHGIEAPATRRAAGKEETGTIRVRASLAGGSVHLEVADDGAGLDTERLVARAVETGLLAADEAAGLGAEATIDLVFLPGFSTAAVADRVSGRGMGLDVVHSGLRAVGGTVAVSPRGELGGASFHLALPASLVSLRGLDVRCGATTAVLPLDDVERTLRVRAEALCTLDGATAVPLDDGSPEGAQPIRLRELGPTLGIAEAAALEGWLPVVVLRAGRRRLGVLVDEILGEGDHPTQRLPASFGRLPGLSGATILADGRVAPVVDVPDLFAGGEQSAPEIRRAVAPPRRKVLIVDDSITSRTLEKSILEAAGYDVATGVDGADGWEKLAAGDFDLLVSDIEMPRLDGLELTRRVRADKRLATLPVIVVSSLGSPADVASGAAAGADEYLVKRQLDQRSLLDAVSRHLP